MTTPPLLTWQTVIRWTAGVIAFVILMTTFWGTGYLLFSPAAALVAFRFRLILEPRWNLDAELDGLLGRG